MSTETGAGVRRREFLKIVGGTTAVASTVGCNTDKIEKLIPYLVSPDQTVPGVSSYYATTCRECAAACGILAETRDGRVIKVEGNPEHPVNRGALCARGQASVQGLYNPDRFRGPMMRKGGALAPVTWDEAMRTFSQKLAEASGRGGDAAVFINQHESGSFPAFLDSWLASHGFGPHYAYDAEFHGALGAANKSAYGVAWPSIDFTQAKLVVSFGADFLEGWGYSVPQQLSWADARAKIENAPRLVYIGPRRSLTGLNADTWIPAKAGSELAIANALLGRGSAQEAATAAGIDAGMLNALIAEVGSTKPALFLAGAGGANASSLATAVAALNGAGGAVGTALNASKPLGGGATPVSHATMRELGARMASGSVAIAMVRGANPAYTMPGNAGFIAGFQKVPFKVSFSSYPDETAELCDLVLPDHHPLESWGDAEPVPGTLGLQQPAMDPVFDTRATADVLLAVARQNATIAGRFPSADYRSWLISRLPGGAPGLTAALPTGMMSGSAMTSTAAPRPASTGMAKPPARSADGEFDLVVYQSPVLGDGRGANKPWLQELSDPVTKLCWQSWVEVHPQTAVKLDIQNGDDLTVTTTAGAFTAPAYIYMGVRPDTIAVATGRGHHAYGRYAKDVGINPLVALPVNEEAATGALVHVVTGAKVSKTGHHSALVTTEGSARQHGRGIGQALIAINGVLHQAPGAENAGEGPAEGGTQHTGIQGERGAAPGGSADAREGAREGGNLAGSEGGSNEMPGDAPHDFLPGLRSPVANDAQGDLGNPASKDKGMYDPQHWSGMARRRWAMTIDLARCTGCSACITACYAENNIPTVGAPWQGRALAPGLWDERPGNNILKGREMTWLRLERYYEGGDTGDEGKFDPNFDTRFVPMLCQHCGNAPCEPVCPVYATYHAPDGLNVQVYNRCVGTRYCANNCPYKVRYFNWFGYGEPERRQYAWPEPMHLQLNPDVTVRGKGVMEKCTFCVQRIREAEHRAKMEKRDLVAEEFTTSCAQACPSRAITFGDAADPTWRVAQLANDRRAYHVFEELNTYTAVVYLKKVNHPAAGTAAPVAAEAH